MGQSTDAGAKAASESDRLLTKDATQPPAPWKFPPPAAAIILLIILILKGVQPIMTKFTMVNGEILYRASSVVLTVDVIKFMFCGVFFGAQMYTETAEERKEQFASLSVKGYLQYCIPAFTFTAGSNSTFLILMFIDSSTFMAFSNLKVFITMFLYGLFFKKPVNVWQWLAAFLAFVGSLISQIGFAQSTSEMASLHLLFFTKRFFGIALTVAMLFMHVGGSVTNEWLFKDKFKQSLLLQNCQLYSWAIFTNGVVFMVTSLKDGNQSFWHGYNTWTAILIALTVIYGLTTSLCLKYLDNIAYMYATLFASCLTPIISYTTGAEPVTLSLVLGMSLIIFSVILYYDWKRVKEAVIRCLNGKREGTNRQATHNV